MRQRLAKRPLGRWQLVATLLAALASGSLAQTKPDLLAAPDDKPIRGMSWPALSPDGKTLCFTYLGDLWRVDAQGGNATRLTVHEGLDAFARWSPDGKWIAFTSQRNGNADAFLIPAQGGAARQVTYHSANDWVNDWSPDGTKLLFYSNRDSRSFALYSIDLKTRATRKLTQDAEAVRFGSISPDGTKLAYTRSGQPWWRPWYRGSVAAKAVIADIATGKMKTLFKSEAQQFWPLFAPDGKSVYVSTVHGASNTPNIWRIPIEGGKPQPVTKCIKDAVRFPTIARNGSLLAYLWNGDLYTIHPDGSDARKLTIIAASDDKVNNQESQTLTSGVLELEPTADGRTIGFVLRGEIWTVPPTGGEAKRITEDPANDNDFNWSPDGKKIVFLSDRGNQPDLYILDIAAKKLTRLTDDKDAESAPSWSPDGRWISYAKAGGQPGLYIAPSNGGASRKLAAGNGTNNFGVGITSHAWSPDSRWLAFSRMDRYSGRDIFVVPAVGGAEINVTRYPSGSNVDPQFTKDGRRLVFLSDRTGPLSAYQVPLEPEDDEDERDENGKPKPKPDRSKDVKIDFEDIHLRAVAAMPAIGNVGEFALTPDSQRMIANINGNFWSISLRPGFIQQLTTSASDAGRGIRILADGSRFYYTGAQGTIRSMALMGGAPATVNFSAQMLFDRRALYLQAFNEFYRRFGAVFYDAKMHGVDWKALRDKYEPWLQGVGTPDEFANVLAMMVGEINSSHSEINAANNGRGPKTATLGVFYDESYVGPGLKVKSLMAKGPADKPKTRIQPGEYILSIDGKEVTFTEDLYLTLQDKAGKSLEVVVNSKPDKAGARTLKIKPITSQEWNSLEYEAKVKQTRDLVTKLSDGRLGYLHIPAMNQPSLQRFIREISEETMLAKEGLVLDIRNNGGGNTHDALLNALSRKVYGYTQPRDGYRQMQPEFAWTKPIVLLIDENSYSDGEIFPAGFRALGLGKIVGVPTPGYVIGTYGGTLVDGTSFRLPSWGWYTADGKNMENLGIPPDIYVENPPEENGADKQLEVAIQTILKQLPLKSTQTNNDTDSRVDVRSAANDNPNGGSAAIPPPAQRPGKRGGKTSQP